MATMPRVLAALAALAAVGPVSVPCLARDAVDETVRSLVDAEDPLKDRFAQGWLEEVRREPGLHLPVLLKYIDLKAAGDAPDWEVSRLAGNAAAVAVAACGEDGRVAVAKLLGDLQAERDRLRVESGDVPGAAASDEPGPDKGRLRKREYKLRHLEEALIDVFARQKDPRVRDAVVARLVKGDHAAASAYLEYLDAACRGDAEVREKLKPLLETPGTALYQNAKLKAYLKATAAKR